MFIRARHDDRPCNEVCVVRDHDATFASIQQFVRLKTKTSNFSNVTIGPSCAKAVGRVFDQGDICGVTKRHDGIHVRVMTAHMADDDCVNVRELLFKVFNVDPIIITAFAQNWDAIRMQH